MTSIRMASAAICSLVAVFSLLTQVPESRASGMIWNLPEGRSASRLASSMDLLGKRFDKGVIRTSSRVLNVYPFLQILAEKALPKRFKSKSDLIALTVLSESKKYDFDPLLILAVIKHESRFNPLAKGLYGEIGLMQIKPDTAKWIADRFDIPYVDARSLRDPVTNIRIGAAFLALLRDKFDADRRLYLSAYNMGAANLNRALKNQIRPKDYHNLVMDKYLIYQSEILRVVRADKFSRPQNAAIPVSFKPYETDSRANFNSTHEESYGAFSAE